MDTHRVMTTTKYLFVCRSRGPGVYPTDAATSGGERGHETSKWSKSCITHPAITSFPSWAGADGVWTSGDWATECKYDGSKTDFPTHLAYGTSHTHQHVHKRWVWNRSPYSKRTHQAILVHALIGRSVKFENRWRVKKVLRRMFTHRSWSQCHTIDKFEKYYCGTLILWVVNLTTSKPNTFSHWNN